MSIKVLQSSVCVTKHKRNATDELFYNSVTNPVNIHHKSNSTVFA